MIEEEDSDDFKDNEVGGPEVKKFTDTDLVRWMSILFVFAVYFFIFLKIMVLS